MITTRSFVIAFALACSSSSQPDGAPYAHSSSLALSSDGQTLYVVNPDADSVAEIDVASRALKREMLLADAHPSADVDGAFTPAVMPRAVVLSPDGATLYVTGERSGRVYALDLASGAERSAPLCSEPVGLVRSADGQHLFVSCTQDNVILRVNAGDLSIDLRASVASEPWSLAWSADGNTVYATHFLAPAVTALDASSMHVLWSRPISDVPPRGDKRLAHGEARALYDVSVRPGTSELWIAHALLATDTAQPELDFESTAFPALTVMNDAGMVQATMSTNAQDISGVNGAFADVVSGPHAMAFTRDGSLAFVVDQNSEDVLIVDTTARTQTTLVRPLPGHMPAGIVLSPDERTAFVQEQNTNDVAVVDITRSAAMVSAVVEDKTIPSLQGDDPMPAEMRLGQHLFYSANSDEYPITKNHWIACATCHPEGRSDAVTWRFEEGPRDTPTNAGGMLGTGFLFRTADRTKVQDYFRTVNVEQGGTFDPSDPAIPPLLDAIATYVNFGIPLPIPPTTDPSLAARGKVVFQGAGCASCHSGPRFTDSGSGNDSLDLGGVVVLHDVGTCAAGVFPDVIHDDIAGHERAACAFDTPSLSGLASSPPYMHDGSAVTIRDAVDRMLAPSHAAGMSDDDETALVEYLRSL